MKKTALLIGLAFTSLSACAQTDQFITAAYDGMKFQVPESPVIVGSLGANNDILLVKYSHTIGKQYISFGTENILETGGCGWSDFFEATLSENKAHSCDQASVESFQSVFVQGGDSGTWKIADKVYYHFLSDQGASFVFFQSNNGNLIKLESDFLDSDGFRRVLGDI
ncbi:hypothetical protein MIH18_18350 [Marinobacter sp. M3C]|uniref:hypothetical protein n=1 Tax=unclassified Marinobacter TaxID=83889 RepID=UPI00200C2B29|nr:MULTISPECIES: hypothetical protein [unclassified Marinobacter]UQG54975.1 hypothetical protein MIH16_16295 [Marinobacter sp. M4C]UQG59654.1 hypothetical protein MIH18_18350 [Marinobacter sp. M3C]UQG63776.1 hypothetical protein MIH17_16280 [Marinobacter sp. M2C]UQG68059.1 hypothetical protein MIH19_16295 [Marinobacter sp. M1C]